jgi:hypothetical protein
MFYSISVLFIFAGACAYVTLHPSSGAPRSNEANIPNILIWGAGLANATIWIALAVSIVRTREQYSWWVLALRASSAAVLLVWSAWEWNAARTATVGPIRWSMTSEPHHLGNTEGKKADEAHE